MPESPPAPVLVVGAGPVGLTVANLLASRAVPVVVIERNARTSDEAKAISIDDESLRTYAGAGIVGEILNIVVPGTGTVYFDRRGRPVVHASGPNPRLRGFPFKNQFAQPELEAVLLKALHDRGVDVRFNTEFQDFVETSDGIIATVRSTDTGAESTVDASWLLGCDGGRSPVRDFVGVAMTGTSHDEVWLVIDTVGDDHRERYGMHHGDPRRPAVVVPGRNGRCRYEFLQFPGEARRGEAPSIELIRTLLKPFRDITEDQVERCTAYTFNAVVADRWRVGRAFLLGDAAHMMPPFAGQGLNSGVRDAANLAWKLAGVWHGELGEQVLDTYEAERAPHAAAIVRFSERLGQVVMTTSRQRALVRDLIVRGLRLTGRGRRYLSEMRFRPCAVHTEGVVIPVGGTQSDLVGNELPQPLVLIPPALTAGPLDPVLGQHFALVGVDVTDADWEAAQRALGERVRHTSIDVRLGDRLPRDSHRYLSVADADGGLERALGPAKGRFVLVKPDRYIATVFTAAEAGHVADELSRLVAATEPGPRADAHMTDVQST